MAGRQSKMALMLLVVMQAVIVICSNDARDRSSESSEDISSSENKDSDARRGGQAQQWQFEGMVEPNIKRRYVPIRKIAQRPSYRERESRRRVKLRREYGSVPSEPHAKRRTEKTTRHHTTRYTTTPATVKITPAPTPVFPPLNRRYRRIYNADETAVIDNYPFMAAILVNKQLWCGGAVIAPDSVLTAAHCLQLQYNNRFFREYVKMLSVRVGSSNATAGGEVMRVTEIFFHPNYKPNTLEFNFAVLKIHKNVTVDKDVKVKIIEFSRNKVVPIDKNITFLGWGSVLGIGDTGGQVLLQKLDLPVYDLADCQEIYGRDLVTRGNFCAGYITKRKNVCNHDAGGPAIMDGVLTGILSFSSKRCDETDKPAVFSNTGVAADWLETVFETKPTAGDVDKIPEWMNAV